MSGNNAYFTTSPAVLMRRWRNPVSCTTLSMLYWYCSTVDPCTNGDQHAKCQGTTINVCYTGTLGIGTTVCEGTCTSAGCTCAVIPLNGWIYNSSTNQAYHVTNNVIDQISTPGPCCYTWLIEINPMVICPDLPYATWTDCCGVSQYTENFPVCACVLGGTSPTVSNSTCFTVTNIGNICYCNEPYNCGTGLGCLEYQINAKGGAIIDYIDCCGNYVYTEIKDGSIVCAQSGTINFYTPGSASLTGAECFC